MKSGDDVLRVLSESIEENKDKSTREISLGILMKLLDNGYMIVEISVFNKMIEDVKNLLELKNRINHMFKREV